MPIGKNSVWTKASVVICASFVGAACISRCTHFRVYCLVLHGKILRRVNVIQLRCDHHLRHSFEAPYEATLIYFKASNLAPNDVNAEIMVFCCWCCWFQLLTSMNGDGYNGAIIMPAILWNSFKWHGTTDMRHELSRPHYRRKWANVDCAKFTVENLDRHNVVQMPRYLFTSAQNFIFGNHNLLVWLNEAFFYFSSHGTTAQVQPKMYDELIWSGTGITSPIHDKFPKSRINLCSMYWIIPVINFPFYDTQKLV